MARKRRNGLKNDERALSVKSLSSFSFSCQPPSSTFFFVLFSFLSFSLSPCVFFLMGADRLGNRFNQRRNHIEPNFADWIRFLRWGNKVGTFFKSRKRRGRNKKDLKNSGRPSDDDERLDQLSIFFFSVGIAYIRLAKRLNNNSLYLNPFERCYLLYV